MSALRANELSGSVWLKNSFSIWRNLHKDQDASGHPATFPVSLATKTIECFAANQRGVLLDPFAGSGSSMIAAMRLGMGAIGFDINPEYRSLFEQRISLLEIDIPWEYHISDARNIGQSIGKNTIEICLTEVVLVRWTVRGRE